MVPVRNYVLNFQVGVGIVTVIAEVDVDSDCWAVSGQRGGERPVTVACAHFFFFFSAGQRFPPHRRTSGGVLEWAVESTTVPVRTGGLLLPLPGPGPALPLPLALACPGIDTTDCHQ